MEITINRFLTYLYTKPCICVHKFGKILLRITATIIYIYLSPSRRKEIIDIKTCDPSVISKLSLLYKTHCSDCLSFFYVKLHQYPQIYNFRYLL